MKGSVLYLNSQEEIRNVYETWTSGCRRSGFFGEPKFDGRILAELEKQAGTGTIRVLDAMVLFEDESGESWRMDLEDLPPRGTRRGGFH